MAHQLQRARNVAASVLPTRHVIAPLVGAFARARWRASEPSSMDDFGRERPRLARGEGVAPGVAPGATPPQRRAAPAAKKGGSLPSCPSPLARFGSAGLGRKTRTETAKNGRWCCCTPHLVLCCTPPSVGATFRAAPTVTPTVTPERSRRQVNITFVIPPSGVRTKRPAGFRSPPV